MPTKMNRAREQQNYIPAGNGDASGEYGNDKGSNKHFTNFKKSDSSFDSVNQQRMGNKMSSQPMKAEQKPVKDFSITKEQWEKNLMTTERVGNPPEEIKIRVEDTPIKRIDEQDISDALQEFEKGTVEKAANLIRKYEESVDETATDLQSIADSSGGLMVGMAFRLKRLSSLSRKLESEVIEQRTKGNENFTIDDAVGNMKDVARFTMVFDKGNFENNVKNAMDQLQKSGYKMVRAKNTFYEGAGYKGLNCNFIDKKGNIFELQFHIPESMKIKEGIEVDMANKKAISNRRNVTAHDIYETTREIEDKIKQNKATEQEKKLYNDLTQESLKRWGTVPNYEFAFLK